MPWKVLLKEDEDLKSFLGVVSNIGHFRMKLQILKKVNKHTLVFSLAERQKTLMHSSLNQLMPIFHKLFLNHSIRPVFTLIPKLDWENILKIENHRPMFIMNMNVKILIKILMDRIYQYMKELYTMTNWDLSQEYIVGLLS